MPATSASLKPGSLPAALGRGLLAAVAAGILGSIVHASMFYIGSVPVPWGVALAWLFLGLLVYWAAAASGRLLAGAIGFIGCYAVTGLLSFAGHDQLILSLAYFKYLPGPALASVLWTYGMVLPAVAGLLAALRVLRRRHR